MLYDAKGYGKIYIAPGYTDMRKSTDGLKLIIGRDLKLNPYRKRGCYIHLQEKGSDDFKPGVSFTSISALHDFDNELRIPLLKLLLDIEVIARARIAYAVAHAWGPMG